MNLMHPKCNGVNLCIHTEGINFVMHLIFKFRSLSVISSTALERSCKSCRTTRFYLKAMYSRILFTFRTIFSVIKTKHSNHFASVEEKPNITSFRRLENISEHYDTKVTLECKASGIPRPQVILLVNALNANKIDSGHSIMAPYVTTVTFKLKMTSEVECQVSNRMGIDFVRTRIEMRGIFAFFHYVPAVVSVRWKNEE